MPTNRLIGKANIPEQDVQHAQEFPFNFVPTIGVAGGMDMFNDPTKIDMSKYTTLQNVRIRSKKSISRRNGYSVITPTKPDSNKVLAFYATTFWNNNIVQLRFTRNAVNLRSGVWTAFGGLSLNGSDTDRFRILSINNRVFISNNGVDPIRELDLVGNNVIALGDAPSFKYIASFGNRIVGANLTTPFGGGNPNPTLVGWCGDTNFGEWNPLVDFSAGSNPLIDTQAGHSEFLSGIIGFESTMLVMRQESIVLAVLQPSATNPFYFYVAVPGIGCNAPDTLQNINGGVMFYDDRTQMVYRYYVGGQIEYVGIPVAAQIAAQVTDPSLLYANFDRTNLEYQLCIPVPNTVITNVWIYNFKTDTWLYDQVNNISSIDASDYSAPGLTIGGLIGTIGQQVGTIGDYTTGVLGESRFIGQMSGDIWLDDPTQFTDAGATYISLINSKIFESAVYDTHFKRVRLEFKVYTPSTFSLLYSKDDGGTFNLYKTITLQPGTARQLIIGNRNIRSRTLKWQLISQSGSWELVDYEVQGTMGSTSRVNPNQPNL